jgi:hypothetical protein
MTQLRDITQQLREEGAAEPHEICGCSDEEIERIRVDQGVERLPASYIQFLRTMGRGAGELLVGTDVFYPEILGIKADAQVLFRECNFSVPTFEDSVVIAMHQGYEVYWLESCKDEDPPVFLYHEYEETPRRRWPNLVEFLAEAAAEVGRR